MNLSIKLLFCYLFTLVSSEEKKILDMRFFTLETTTDWSFDEGKGADSWVGDFLIDNKEILKFDFGRYSCNTITGNDFYISNDSLFTENYIDNKQNFVFVKMRNQLNLNSNTQYHLYYYKTINGFKAKILTPAKTGKGITSISFDKTKTQGLCLKIYGYNLSFQHQNELLTYIKTLKFKDYKKTR